MGELQWPSFRKRKSKGCEWGMTVWGFWTEVSALTTPTTPNPYGMYGATWTPSGIGVVVRSGEVEKDRDLDFKIPICTK